MGVPPVNRTNNSTRILFDDAYIQRIPKRGQEPSTQRPRTTRAPRTTRKPYWETFLNRSTFSEDQRNFIHKRFNDLFNSTHLLHSHYPPLSSSNINDDLFKIPLPTKIHVEFKYTSRWSTSYIIFGVLLCILKVFVCWCRIKSKLESDEAETMARRMLTEDRTESPVTIVTRQQPPIEIESPTITLPVTVTHPEMTYSIESDLPPSYSQVANITGVDNKMIEKITDEPPPYYLYQDAVNNTDETTKGDRKKEVQEQPERNTDIRLNNKDATDRTNDVRNHRTEFR